LTLEVAMRRFVISAAVAGFFVIMSPHSVAADKARAQKHMTADQVSACVKQAVGARAGNITKLEVKVDDNRTICEVHLEDAKGKNFEAHIDVAANKLLRVKD
jgi:hypothetical protein